MKSRRARCIAMLGIAVPLLFGACTGADDTDGARGGNGAQDAGATVMLSAIDNRFEPKELALAAGKTITVEFTNDGDAAHTFTSEALGVDTGIVDPGESVSVTFDAPDGPVTFICSIHVDTHDMVGEIVPKQ